jgi:hypothetical protein
MLIHSLVLATLISGDYYHVEKWPANVQWGWDHPTQAKAMVFGADILIGCVKAGLGSDDGFLAGCAQGAFGGGVLFVGQVISTHAISQNQAMPFPAIGKIVEDFGVSIEDNVTYGYGMFDSYQTDIGPIFIKLGRDPNIRISGISSGALVFAGLSKYKFDWKASLNYMTPVVKANRNFVDAEAITLGNVIVYGQGYRQNSTLSHELMHVSQFRQIRFIDEVITLHTPKDAPSLFTDVLPHLTLAQDLSAGLLETACYRAGHYWKSPIEVEAYYMEHK